MCFRCPFSRCVQKEGTLRNESSLKQISGQRSCRGRQIAAGTRYLRGSGGTACSHSEKGQLGRDKRKRLRKKNAGRTAQRGKAAQRMQESQREMTAGQPAVYTGPTYVAAAAKELRLVASEKELRFEIIAFVQFTFLFSSERRVSRRPKDGRAGLNVRQPLSIFDDGNSTARRK